MKEITLPYRMHLLANRALDALTQPDEQSRKRRTERQAQTSGEGRPARKEFFFYQPIIDQDSQQTVGHLSDISSRGFKLDCQDLIPVDKDFRFGVLLSNEVADKSLMVFYARSRWCKVDPLDPYVYNVGFQLLHISPDDLEIFNRMMEKYGREARKRNVDLRRSNKW